MDRLIELILDVEDVRIELEEAEESGGIELIKELYNELHTLENELLNFRSDMGEPHE